MSLDIINGNGALHQGYINAKGRKNKIIAAVNFDPKFEQDSDVEIVGDNIRNINGRNNDNDDNDY